MNSCSRSFLGGCCHSLWVVGYPSCSSAQGQKPSCKPAMTDCTKDWFGRSSRSSVSFLILILHTILNKFGLSRIVLRAVLFSSSDCGGRGSGSAKMEYWVAGLMVLVVSPQIRSHANLGCIYSLLVSILLRTLCLGMLSLTVGT